MGTLDIVVVFVYLAAMLGVGFYAKGKIQTMDDFILGGKRFNLFALVGTIMATMIGSGMTMGAVGDVYKKGIGGNVFWMYLGFGLGLVFFGMIVKPIRETGKRTMSEILSYAYGDVARILSAIVVIIYGISIVAINIAGLRTVIMYAFGDNMPISLPLATILAACVCIAFTSMGGFYAVVWTDVAQLVIMIVGTFILGPIIGLNMAGGATPIINAYEAAGMSILNPLQNGINSSAIGFFLAYFLMVPGDPTMPQRALASKDTRSGQLAYYISGAIGFLLGIILIIIGGAAFVVMPGLENPETALPVFIMKYYPPIIKGLSISGIIAAIMSSFSSFLILSSTHLIYDLGSSFKKDIKESSIKKIMPIATIVIGIIGIVIALYITSMFTYLYMVFSVIASAMMPAFMGALFFRDKTSKVAGVSSIVVGTLVPAILYLTVGYDVFLGDPLFLGVISSTGVLILFSILFKNKPQPAAKQAE